MTIKEDLAAELRDAIKSGDRNRRDVIRQIETEIARARAEPGFTGEVDDELYRAVIGSYVKKMHKALEEYEGMGERGAPLAAKLSFEVEYLGRWLPRRLGEEETRAVVRSAVAELGAGSPAEAGRVIGHMIKQGVPDGELDGALVARLVREELAGE